MYKSAQTSLPPVWWLPGYQLERVLRGEGRLLQHVKSAAGPKHENSGLQNRRAHGDPVKRDYPVALAAGFGVERIQFVRPADFKEFGAAVYSNLRVDMFVPRRQDPQLASSRKHSQHAGMVAAEAEGTDERGSAVGRSGFVLDGTIKPQSAAPGKAIMLDGVAVGRVDVMAVHRSTVPDHDTGKIEGR